MILETWTRAILIDPNPGTCGAMAACLSHQPGIEVCAQAQHAGALRTLIDTHDPDVALVALRENDASSLEYVYELASIDTRPRFIAVLTRPLRAWVERTVELGFAGCVLRSDTAEEFAAVIRRVHAGEAALSTGLVKLLLAASAASYFEVV